MSRSHKMPSPVVRGRLSHWFCCSEYAGSTYGFLAFAICCFHTTNHFSPHDLSVLKTWPNATRGNSMVLRSLVRAVLWTDVPASTKTVLPDRLTVKLTANIGPENLHTAKAQKRRYPDITTTCDCFSSRTAFSKALNSATYNGLACLSKGFVRNI